MKVFRVLILFSVIALMAALAGCSSSGTDPVAKVAGDTTATEYKAAEQVFSDANDLGDDGLGLAIGMASDVIGSAQSTAGGRLNELSSASVQADTLEYHFSSDYWYRVHSQVDTEYVGESDAIKSIIEWHVRDSLQFRHGNDPVILPDSALLTELRFGRVAEGWNILDADSLTVRQSASIEGAAGEITGLGDVVINSNAMLHGTSHEQVENLETAYACAFQFDLNGSWNDIALNMFNVIELGDCPSAGSIMLAGHLSADCLSEADSVQFNGQWSGSLTYDNGSVTAVFENETTRWTHTEACSLTQPLAVRFKK